jgi:hypothetical protein
VNENLNSELEMLRKQIPSTRLAIITFEKHSVQMLFSPEQALIDFRRKIKELWNIPEKMFYLLVNGKHEDQVVKEWPTQSLVTVCLRGLLGGEGTGVVIISFDGGDDYHCWATQSFREAAEANGLEIKADLLFDCETGEEFRVDDTIGDYYESGSSHFLQWDGEGDDQMVEVVLHLGGKQRTTLAEGKLTLEDLMTQFHDDIFWTGFSMQGQELDSRLPLLYLCDEDVFPRRLEIDVQQDEADSSNVREELPDQAEEDDEEFEIPSDAELLAETGIPVQREVVDDLSSLDAVGKESGKIEKPVQGMLVDNLISFDEVATEINPASVNMPASSPTNWQQDLGDIPRKCLFIYFV